MTPSPFRRLVFGALRRLLYLWVRSETINQSSLSLNLDRSRPVFYVLQSPSLTELAVVDTECSKAGLPRPVLPVAVGTMIEQFHRGRAYAFVVLHHQDGLLAAAVLCELDGRIVTGR